ncbi:Na+/H+ antiporter NhaA [Helicobacter monodelphidis]|uniref:Na+/H+ antiporter NhaA n=1 Tax=Helicobacter sp. 15-1451 TaxID=2004995 RepID=UPI000DCB5BF1|nr:Na+/H+ antiporter NhaA [Helicobacter sp. 15-1451]RAX57327.1 Na+/H+ antiporter NhaA [Helicobacter sp. 15-1451]
MSDHVHSVGDKGFVGMLTRFIKSESFGGIFLFICAVLAMIVANSPLAEYYFHAKEVYIGFSVGEKVADAVNAMSHYTVNWTGHVGLSVEHWINDVLMAFFFLVVGLEIKREMMYGALASFKKAAFPVIAALGGMIVPGLIYYGFNIGTPSQNGFGIPMATDIAFALGVMLMLGSRVPAALKVFLVTLAVADDLGAIIVIAIFYTTTFQAFYLAIAAGIVVVLLIMNRMGVRSIAPYLILGVPLWLAVHACGIHATISAVVLAFTIPSVAKVKASEYLENAGSYLEIFKKRDEGSHVISDDQIHQVAHIIKDSKFVQSPLVRIEHALSPWSSYFIMPLFAFANAGVTITSDIDFGVDGILLGIALGLIVGKPVGILLATFLSEKLGIAARPEGIGWIDILGAGMLAGIGFTMSLFVTALAFTNPQATDLAKITILCSSLLAGILGAAFLLIESSLKHKH